MKKVVGFILLIVLLVPINVSARRGCCSWHGGVSGACRNGYQVCNDGTTSPSCTCSGGTSSSSSSSSRSSYGSSSSSSRQTYTPSYTYGCTDKNALNYNPKANKDDGSCIAKVLGCTDKAAINYNSSANTNDNSCQYEKEITETEKVKYKTKYIDNDEMDKGEEKVKTAGKDGEKSVVYTVTLDAAGNEINREKKSETVTLEAKEEVIERGTHEDSAPAIGILWIICLIIAFYQAFKNKDGNLLLNKIQKQKDFFAIILYILYVITVVPAFIDVIIIITNKLKQKRNNMIK